MRDKLNQKSQRRTQSENRLIAHCAFVVQKMDTVSLGSREVPWIEVWRGVEAGGALWHFSFA